jgi:hypothetical protein
MINSDPIARHRLCADHENGVERMPGSCLAFWVEDATYIDPVMDSWGQDVAARLIEGLWAAIRASFPARRNAGAGGAIPLGCVDRAEGADRETRQARARPNAKRREGSAAWS